jgi:putative glutamine amidotransferase
MVGQIVQPSTPTPQIDPKDPEQCSRLALRLGTTTAEVQQGIRNHGSATDAIALHIEQRRHERRPILPERVHGAPIIGVLSESLLVQEQPLFAAASAAVDAVLQVASGIPRILPVASAVNVDALLEGLDGLFVPGGQSNVHPARYGKQADERRDGPFDELRDEAALQIIPLALQRGIPCLFTCRGFQELNVAFGGTLKKESTDIPDNRKHGTPTASSEDGRHKLRQKIRLNAGGTLHRICGCGEMIVNSLHSYLIDELAPGLVAEAVAEDGSIEAATVRDAPAFNLGTVFHPEYWAGSDPISTTIMSAFGAAASEHAVGRAQARG